MNCQCKNDDACFFSRVLYRTNRSRYDDATFFFITGTFHVLFDIRSTH